MRLNRKTILITDKRMTRFFFTLDEAVNAVFKCIKEKRNIIPEMKSLKIYDLAKAISDNVKIIGLRPGEKLHETLVADYEGKELSTKTAKKFTKNEIKQIVEAVINGISR
jgi:FlaA1/EpsC-like NDP-sugar epimerase